MVIVRTPNIMTKPPSPVKRGLHPPLDQASEGLAQIAAVLRAEAIATGMRTQVSAAQGRVLALLGAAPSGMRLSEIALRLGVSAASASDTVAGLVGRRLVTRSRDRDDARAVRFNASSRAGARANPGRSALAAAIGDLPPSDRAGFQSTLVQIILNLQKRGEIPTARACINCRFFKPLAHRNEEAPHHCDYVDAAFGDGALRVLCAEFDGAEPEEALRNQTRWQAGRGEVFSSGLASAALPAGATRRSGPPSATNGRPAVPARKARTAKSR